MMCWIHIHEGCDCGGLFEIKGPSGHVSHRFKCSKCGMFMKEILWRMPPHPQPEHRDAKFLSFVAGLL